MPSDSDVSRRKHRRSSPSDEEAGKSSKRHKHRHHRHHRHHRSEKHVEEIKQKEMDSAAPHAVSAGNDDVEEGEILEEDKDVELGDVESDSLNLGVQADKSGNGFVTRSKCDVKFVDEPSFSVDSKVDEFHINPEAHANGDSGYEYNEDDKRRQGRSSRKKTSYPYVDSAEGDSIKLNEHRKSSSERDKHKIVEHSPSYKVHDEEVRTRRRSLSHDGSRERSRSRSIREEEEEEAKRRRFLGRVDDDSDDGRITTGNSHHGSRDLMRDMERERSGGYNRFFEEDREMSRDRETDRNLRRDSRRKGSRDRDLERDRRIERGRREESRDRDGRRERDREWSRDRDMDRDWRREHERERSKDMELERDWRRVKDRERSREWEVDRDRRQEKDRERSRDGEFGRERIREKERERSKDREVDVERRREKERHRSKEREKESDKYRQKDRDWSNDMYHARGSARDREREKDSHRYRDRFRDGDDRESQKERERRYDKNRDNARDRRSDSEKVHISNSDSSVGRDKLSRDEDDQDDFEERISLKLAEQEEEDLNRIKEESRKRRQAILEKYKKPQLQHQENQTKSVEKDGESGQHPAEAPQAAKVASESPDGRIDGGDASVADPLFSVGKSPAENGVQALQRASGAAGLGEGTPKSERSNDKYCDDIFGETPTGIRRTGKEDGLPVNRGGFHDNWDDPEGYYSYRFGEVLDGRYEVAAAHGKGVFSTVVRAKDLKASAGDPEEVAIKIIRNNETMNKAGKEEVQILKKLAALDPENKRHCVRFVSSFKYRNHLCLVFESLHMNLREVLKKFGRNIGLKLTAVRAYAKQLFIALKHLKNCGVLHCDIKPDNMLVNEAKNVLKLCDFGNAMSAGKNEITPYLVSRFYRAPEIILGLPYDHPMDMWSVGCCLYELYTGKVLFPGSTNNDMLRLHMELKGPFPKKMLKKGAFVDQHFDQDLHFLATEEDPVTKKAVKRLLVNLKPKDIGSIITGSPGEDLKMLANFKDLLDKIFVLDPEKRMTVQQALAHPFITGK